MKRIKRVILMFSLVILIDGRAIHVYAQVNASLRDMICVVKPQLTSEMKTFFSEYGSALSSEGYLLSGAWLNARQSGGFGSGVVVMHDGKYCILTNFHVVEHVQSITVEFQSTSGENRQLRDCRIIARDRNYDLALAEIPANSGISAGFTFAATTLHDGMEVWSAGFPGLGNNPSWQLGKGIVSNEAVKDSLITNAKLPSVIQHTAQVDAGSSGGALLIATFAGEKPAYTIAGINTWKARGRENANFAIPAAAVMAFMDEIQTEPIANLPAEMETRTRELITAGVADNYKTVLPMISGNCIFNVPVDAFLEMFTAASKAARNDAAAALHALEPFEAFRIIIADAIYQRLRKSDVAFAAIRENTGVPAAFITVKGKETEVKWTAERDGVFITGTPLLEESATGQTQTRIWNDIDRIVALSAGFPTDGNERTAYTLTFGRQYARFIGTFWDLTLGKRMTPTQEPDGKGGMTDITMPCTYFGVQYGLQLQFPLKFCPVHTIPFVKIPVGISIGTDASDVNYGVRPGMRFALQLGKKSRFLYMDAEFRYKKFMRQHADYPLLSKSSSMFGMSFGYAY